MIELVEKAFSSELLSVSSKASKLMDFIWTVYKIGGSVPMNTLQEQFDKADEYVEVLSKAGIMRYSLGGFINKSQRKESISVYVSEDFSGILPKGIRRREFEEKLFGKYGERLIGSCRTDLTEPLAVMLTSIIFFAAPNKPVFVNMVVRKGAKVCLKTYVECKDLLDYYLHRFLGLVMFESGSTINLTVRSKQRVRAYPKIWEMYIREYKEKPKVEELKSPMVERRPVPGKVSEQEKKLRGYFPWLKL
ncbi:MAG: hypothetical protein JXC85_00555 [Candidatus Aenigmarchaeota archaeon]|nr:hypothetical protein [Candidatus Aenigmarchaeota archaeon]